LSAPAPACLSIGKVFGRNGYTVALIARDQSKLDALAAQLREHDVDAAGFAADIMDRPSLVDGFDRIKQHYGAIDMLEYSPAPHNPVPGITMTGPLEASVDNLQPQIDFYLHGAVTATHQVLTAMLDRGAGTLLYTTGASSLQPNPMMGNVGPAAAALRNWVLSVHQALAGTGVYAAHVPLNVWLGSGGPDTQADTIAELYWTLHTERADAERLYTTDS
jgi:short-subunit dehydrogenase